MKEKLDLIPTSPGCYMMLNKSGDVIYVGKAKNLRSRVKSYFTGAHNKKTQLLVSEIVDFEYILVNSEKEALILEYNLIKKYAPIYNIRLIDDKSYPYIEITNEKHPMLVVSRYLKPDKNKTLFGPYPNARSARETVKILQKLYPLRRCNPLSKTPCIYYHIGLCLGPCKDPNVDYRPNIESITRFLKGDTKTVINDIKLRMDEASLNLEFEKAKEYRDMITAINQTTQKQIVSLNDYKDRDFISFDYNEDDLGIHILMMRGGRILDSHQEIISYLENPLDTLLIYLKNYYENIRLPQELLFDDRLDVDLIKLYLDTKILIPKRGDKKKLVDLALKNAKDDLKNHSELYRNRSEKITNQLKELSDIVKKDVNHIEVFDNSHLFGSNPISAMITWKDYKLNPKKYRKYHLKTTTNDDYQGIKEVIYRRYYRLLIEKRAFPDLIIVDGGVGQVNAALNVINDFRLDIPVMGLKKDSFHNLEAIVYNGETIMLNKQSNLYQFLYKLSEEVHRFAIDFFRKTKTRKDYASILDDVPGLGLKRKTLLLKNFNSLEAIKNASLEDLKKIGLPERVIIKMKEVLNEINSY